jgi:hypothetical protein
MEERFQKRSLLDVLMFRDIGDIIILEHLDVRSFLNLQVNKRCQKEIFSDEWLAQTFGNISDYPGFSVNSLYRLLLKWSVRDVTFMCPLVDALKYKYGRFWKFGYVGVVGPCKNHDNPHHQYKIMIDKYTHNTFLSSICVVS